MGGCASKSKTLDDDDDELERRIKASETQISIIEAVTAVKSEIKVLLGANEMVGTPVNRNSKKLKEVDYSIKQDTASSDTCLRVFGICCQLDKHHILVEPMDNYVMIINVITKAEVAKMKYTDMFMSANSKHVVTLNNGKGKGEANKTLCVHRIENNQGVFSFVEILRQTVCAKKSNTFVCHFDDADSNKLILQSQNEENNSLEIHLIEDKYEDGCKYELMSTVDLKDVQLDHGSMKSLITSLTKYLVLWKKDANLIYYVDLLKNQIVNTIQATDRTYAIKCVPKTDDVIVMCVNSALYLANERSQLQEIFADWSGRVKGFNVKEDYLIIATTDATYLLKQNSFRSSVNSTPIRIAKYTDMQPEFCTSADTKKYFVIFTLEKELCVYRINDGMKLVSSIQLDYKIKDLFSSDHYICARDEYKNLEVFEIIDSN